jgi:hypothetical protein
MANPRLEGVAPSCVRHAIDVTRALSPPSTVRRSARPAVLEHEVIVHETDATVLSALGVESTRVVEVP